MKKIDKIYVAGHTGLLGSAFVRRLKSEGYKNLILKTRKELDLTCENAVEELFNREKPDYVFIAAGKVGGIIPNKEYPVDFLNDNIKIAYNLINSSWKSGVKKLIYFGCSCTYPRNCPQPVKEESLLAGPFEPTNEAYSVAKLAGLQLCRSYNKQYKTNFICCISENLYGLNDRFDLENSHVVPALIMKYHNSKVNKSPSVAVWGTGKPVRGLLYSDDLVDAALFLIENYDSQEIINVGTKKGVSIGDLSKLVKEVVGYKGNIEFDTTKPDGVPKKMLDGSRLKSLGWEPKTDLSEGLRLAYEWYKRFTP